MENIGGELFNCFAVLAFVSFFVAAPLATWLEQRKWKAQRTEERR